MALINCPECRKEISDKAEFCPNCGYPIQRIHDYVNEHTECESEYIQDIENIDSVKIYNKNEKVLNEFSLLGIIALVLSIFGCTSIFGLILAIIDLKKKDGKNKIFCWFAIGVFAFWFLIIIYCLISSNTKYSNPEAYIKQPESYTEDTSDQSSEIIEEENTDFSNTNDNISYEDVFFYDLTDNFDYYNGKNIRTVIEVDYCSDDEDAPYIRSEYSDSNFVENTSSITIYPYNYKNFERGQYITVEGTVAKNDYKNVITNANIVNFGSEAKNTFESDLAIYIQKYNDKLQQSKESFIASCIDVTYDDLRRYPDSYEDVPIKLTIYASDVEPDGWIFPGDIIATFNGEELAVYDDRKIREPRIMEGDTVTVYAVGYGLTKMQVKQKGVLFNKTVDEYDVPTIKIKYTEKDKDFTEYSDKNNDSIKNAFEKGLNDGLGDSASESIEEIKESIDSIEDSIDYILSD